MAAQQRHRFRRSETPQHWNPKQSACRGADDLRVAGTHRAAGQNNACDAEGLSAAQDRAQIPGILQASHNQH